MAHAQTCIGLLIVLETVGIVQLMLSSRKLYQEFLNQWTGNTKPKPFLAL